ncbi:MAG: TRAP transporter small permease [Bacteroidota bacterium]
MRQMIDKYLGYLLIFLMVLITLDVLWGVFTRYALGSQASWSEELARFLLIWIGILGAAYAAGQRMHLAIELLQLRLDQRGRRYLLKIIAGLVLFFAIGVMVIGGGQLVYLTFILEQRSAALQLPMGLVYGVIPLSGLLISYYKLQDLLES